MIFDPPVEEQEFAPWDGDYDKRFYDVRLPCGEIIKACWPNAGKMSAYDGSSRSWFAESNIEVRVTCAGDHPFYQVCDGRR